MITASIDRCNLLGVDNRIQKRLKMQCGLVCSVAGLGQCSVSSDLKFYLSLCCKIGVISVVFHCVSFPSMLKYAMCIVFMVNVVFSFGNELKLTYGIGFSCLLSKFVHNQK